MLSKIDLDDFMTNDKNADLNRMSVEVMRDPAFREIALQFGETLESLEKAIAECELLSRTKV